MVTGVDVNQRAVLLANENAATLGVADRYTALTPDDVPAEATYDEIWSNPPIRVGKQALHDLLLTWFARLAPDGRAVMVVGKNLGADSLQRWLGEQGYPTERLASAKGFRVLESRQAALGHPDAAFPGRPRASGSVDERVDRPPGDRRRVIPRQGHCEAGSRDAGWAMTFEAADDRYDTDHYRYTGRSGLKLPLLSLGLWQNFGTDRPEETQRAILRRAFDRGVTHFDLANNYGPPYGRAEENFGRYVADDFRPTATSSSSPPRPGTTCGPGRTVRAAAPASTCSPRSTSPWRGWGWSTSTSSTATASTRRRRSRRR